MSQRAFDHPHTPGTPADFETMLSQKALPPVDFNVTKSGGVTHFAIGDRAAVPRRSPTQAYRIYFTPITLGATTLMDATRRKAIFKAGSLVAEVKSQGKATTITATDSQFYGRTGWYSCVGVNMLNEETEPLHLCPSPP